MMLASAFVSLLGQLCTKVRWKALEHLDPEVEVVLLVSRRLNGGKGSKSINS